MSAVKWAYLLLFSRCLLSMYISPGQVSLNMCRFFFSLSSIKMTGFNVVTHSSGGIGTNAHHRPAVPSNSDWEWTVELRAGWQGVPLFTVSRSCKEQLKIGLRWPVVWRLTFSGVGRMITCRRLNILCRVNTKGKWQIQRRMILPLGLCALAGHCKLWIWNPHNSRYNWQHVKNCVNTVVPPGV